MPQPALPTGRLSHFSVLGTGPHGLTHAAHAPDIYELTSRTLSHQQAFTWHLGLGGPSDDTKK